jgi:1-acyl-sn-glycerol-3-phosphate acyltransferase
MDSTMINYIWRIIATGMLFVLFGLGGMCLGYLVLPFLRHNKYKAQYAIHLTFRLFVFGMRFLGLANVTFNHFELLQNDKGCLIISNHPTLIDYVMIVSKLKHCDTLVKQKLWHNPFLKNVVKSAGYIPNLAAPETFERIKETLLADNNLLIFPEGTRTTPNTPLKLKRGAAQIAIRAQVPIRIVTIHCTHSTLNKHSKWYHIPKEKPSFTLTVGERIDPCNFADLPLSLAARKLTRHLKNVLEQAL